MIKRFGLFTFWGSYQFFFEKPGPGDGEACFFPGTPFRAFLPIRLFPPLSLLEGWPESNLLSQRKEEGKKAPCGFPEGNP
jgi:hypothetical protein